MYSYRLLIEGSGCAASDALSFLPGLLSNSVPHDSSRHLSASSSENDDEDRRRPIAAEEVCSMKLCQVCVRWAPAEDHSYSTVEVPLTA
jgi:hypothetical protein